ncbi:hypothetical protein P280DRAFT_490575 [Massarina eburnea CBS 473.64]|uniref:RNA polymerase II subunit A C-terminal domain phosphatase n=1 Tax=Massarina eburnea CBS 473.64 TaxID=1395130 RepID=A0A6A6S0P1_9PLEO|nr:hypothetical protein P280DRAFT_490575 [Massarina eburnea CBS 473.64]
MKITSPPNWHYPVTIGDFAKKTDDEVKRSDPLFTYLYETTVQEGDKWGETKDVKRKFPARFEASLDGIIRKWYIRTGAVVARAGVDLLEIEEPCTHEVQFGGLCAECGQDMTEMDYLTKELNSERATVNMTHDNMALLISHKEAVRAEEDSKKRLLSAKKLSLIVDLDQTVIHTTCERTIAEWQADPDNPNYDAVKDVKGFQLADDNAAHIVASWYYVKMRPGLPAFFDRMSKLYEMHVYTMATRAYAQEVCKIIDPQRRFFGERILSRDENYGEKIKSLNRLFPNHTDMAVIIDDRADIWKYCENLVRVPVFNFFPGAGDINASFLPKQQELVTQPPTKPADVPAKEGAKPEGESTSTSSATAHPTEPVPAASTNGALGDLEQQLISISAVESPESFEEQVKEQEKVILTQQTERPLLQQQLVLDKEDEEAEVDEITQSTENGYTQTTEHHKHRHAVLHDDDRGLETIGAHLRLIHQTFYDEYQRNKIVPHSGRVAELKGQKSPKKRPVDTVVPDVAEIMPRLKRETLHGCVIVFSGIIPLGVDVQNSDFALWVKSFGAQISTTVNKFTTHVIANPDRKTTKVKKAARYDTIMIVNAEWMFQCCTRWEHVDEGPYLIEMDDADKNGSPIEDMEDDSIDVTGDEGADEAESPIQFDILDDDQWSSMNNELDDFLNESDTDGGSASDSESVRSADGTRSEKTKTKRKRMTATEANDVSEDDSDASVKSTSSRLQRKKRRTMERVTSLTNVENAEKSSGLPSPETTGPEEEHGDNEGKTFDPQGEGPDLDSDFDDGLEAAMMDEFEKSASED